MPARIACAKRLPKGLKAAWARLSGQYSRLVDGLTAETKSCDARDRRELEALIDRHLAERRKLDWERLFMQAQLNLQQELENRFATSTLQVHRPDPRQRLVLPREETLFILAQLQAKPELILHHIADKKARFSRGDVIR